MTIFNSLGSNYRALDALRILFSVGGASARTKLSDYLEDRYRGMVILTYKGRDALTLALQALPRGRIAFNGYTCLAVYESVVAAGHQLLYLDIAEGSLDFSAETLRAALETHPDIKAVIVQNTLGIPCDIAAIAALCKVHNLVLIEDLAHSIGTRYANGAEAGTVGDFVILSFSQDKVVDSVSGGALIVRNRKLCKFNLHNENTISFFTQLKDRLYPMLTWKIRFAYALGIGRPYHAFLRILGVLSSPFGKEYGPRALPGWYCSNILRQYEQLVRTAAHRKQIAEIYATELPSALQLQFETARSSNLRFPILVDGRDGLITYLKQRGVHVSDIWYDAPIAPKKYLSRSSYASECPNAETVAARMVNLPAHINISERDAHAIADAVNAWLHREGTNAHHAVEVADGREWETLMTLQQPHSFLQSWLWGRQNVATGSKIFRIGIRERGQLVAAALFIKINARRGSFLLCPHGPVVAAGENEAAVLKQLFGKAELIARGERCAFLRICPLAPATVGNERMYAQLGFRGAPIHMHPELAWMLDITKPEDELLKEMRKTTRYLIKKMEKEGVEIDMSANPDDIEKFWPVYEETVERQQFTPFKKADLRKEFELFAKENSTVFFFGKHRGEIVAAAIIIFYNEQAFYHHSGSTSAGSNVSYLLQWRVIQEAKRRGCTLYNFWGISPDERPDHPWAGLSLFKKGFGGVAEEYLHAQDKPLTARYWINYVVETARRLKRGL